MQNDTILSSIKEKLHEQLNMLHDRYKVSSLGIFGSYLHNSQTSDSDLDLLVTFQVTPSLFKFIELEIFLTDLLNIKVDLVMKNSLKPKIGERILSEVIPV